MAEPLEKIDRKEAVLNAASHLFVANGYMSTTMDDIAATVSLNKGTLYYYYESKSAILFDIIYRGEEGRLAMARVASDRAADANPSDALRQFIEETAIYILENPVSSRISMQESPFIDMWLTDEQLKILNDCHEEFQGYMLSQLERGIAEGLFSGVDPRVAAQGITGALSALPRWFRSKGPLGPEEVARDLANLMLNGVMGGKPVSVPPAIKTRAKRALNGEGPVAAVNKAPKKPRARDKAQERRARADVFSKDLG
ncbi:TetR/AcrR family transcriptional regulator [Sphingobium sp. V4]|uniref:TetR/AcrR family transcriptional regulator n=1 Tax=Sphingobium sp. V4 TaxID=3038927 RepID=UPI002557CB24|nr:TetR/AcrR family transcriptional regulator [Sphingobium sp. V4]WIW89484.1 TetR/AcrR family transcriptional regulator [Sphingobium sp. V4]